MKKIFFDLRNGLVIDPRSLPKYLAIVHRGVVTEIYTCFRVQNIVEKGGQDWVDEQLHSERQDWNNLPLLMKSLNTFVRKRKFWFKQSNHFEKNPNRFIWIRFM